MSLNTALLIRSPGLCVEPVNNRISSSTVLCGAAFDLGVQIAECSECRNLHELAVSSTTIRGSCAEPMNTKFAEYVV
jgi:hypothetical protein